MPSDYVSALKSLHAGENVVLAQEGIVPIYFAWDSEKGRHVKRTNDDLLAESNLGISYKEVHPSSLKQMKVVRLTRW